MLELVKMLPDAQTFFFSLLEAQYFFKFKAAQKFGMNLIGFDDHAIIFVVLEHMALKLALSR